MTVKSLKKDYFWNTVGVFAQNAISPLLLIVITRINGIHDSGLFSFAFSVAVIFWALGMWGGRTYQVSDTKKEFSSQSYIVLRLMLALVMIVGAVVFALINNYDVVKSSILISLVLLKAVESLSDALYGVMQVNNRLYVSGKSLFAKSLIGIIVFIAIDLLTNDIFYSCLGMLLLNILVVFVYDLPVTNKLENLRLTASKILHHSTGAIEIMRRCAPVFAVIFLAMFSLNIPRYFIDTYHQEEIGFFGIIAMPITLMVLFMSFILQPNVVNLSKLYLKNETINFNKIITKIISITVVFGIVVFILTATIGVAVLNVVFNVDFSQHWLSLVIIVAGGVINALVSIFINVLIIMRRIRVQFYILVATNLLLVFISILIIPAYGLLGGAFLFLATNCLQLALLTIDYKSSTKVSK